MGEGGHLSIAAIDVPHVPGRILRTWWLALTARALGVLTPVVLVLAILLARFQVWGWQDRWILVGLVVLAAAAGILTVRARTARVVVEDGVVVIRNLLKTHRVQAREVVGLAGVISRPADVLVIGLQRTGVGPRFACVPILALPLLDEAESLTRRLADSLQVEAEPQALFTSGVLRRRRLDSR